MSWPEGIRQACKPTNRILDTQKPMSSVYVPDLTSVYLKEGFSCLVEWDCCCSVSVSWVVVPPRSTRCAGERSAFSMIASTLVFRLDQVVAQYTCAQQSSPIRLLIVGQKCYCMWLLLLSGGDCVSARRCWHTKQAMVSIADPSGPGDQVAIAFYTCLRLVCTDHELSYNTPTIEGKPSSFLAKLLSCI